MKYDRRLIAILLLLGCLAILTQGIASVTAACHCMDPSESTQRMDAQHEHAMHQQVTDSEHDCCADHLTLSGGAGSHGCNACDCHMVFTAIQPLSPVSDHLFHSDPPPDTAKPSLAVTRPDALYRPPITVAF